MDADAVEVKLTPGHRLDVSVELGEVGLEGSDKATSMLEYQIN